MIQTLKAFREGDTLVAWKLDRLGRSLRDLVSLVEKLNSWQCGLRILTGQGARINTTTPEGRMAFGIFAALAIYGVAFCGVRLASQGIHDSWTTVRCKLARWQRVTTTFSDSDGSRIEVRHDARPDPEACMIGRSAGVPWGPERRSRTLRIRQPG